MAQLAPKSFGCGIANCVIVCSARSRAFTWQVPMAHADVFKHSSPSLYDRYMGPLLFEPYARYVAERVALFRPERILETAAGTGIVTRAVSEAVPEATIVATDINPAVVEFAAQHVHSERVTFQRADAQDLPFDDATFDLVVCLFGVMFFPDKVRANAEARRVLRPGGRYVCVTFDRLDLNPIPKEAGEAVATLFPDDPRYMERGPFSYTDLCTGRGGSEGGRFRGDRTRDGRVVEPGDRPGRSPRDCAGLTVPGGNRTARRIGSRARGDRGRNGSPSLGRDERTDVRTHGDRHQVARRSPGPACGNLPGLAQLVERRDLRP